MVHLLMLAASPALLSCSPLLLSSPARHWDALAAAAVCLCAHAPKAVTSLIAITIPTKTLWSGAISVQGLVTDTQPCHVVLLLLQVLLNKGEHTLMNVGAHACAHMHTHTPARKTRG